MDRMMGGSNLYPTQERQEVVRHTINAPANYVYNQQDNLSRHTGNFDYERETQEVASSQAQVVTSQIDLNPQPLEINPFTKNENEFNMNAQLMAEIRTMKAQQDKILENQNIFQSYIINEITTIKNRMNQ
mmetsp:Transcript_23660/g.21027  ORF Transcript_23660/g.21027 Transcript_23660/m.21027 type:complete len:130 (+) Transcript_23660:105-494(+)|eukprot:CAMPEP_0205802914 /NCGR_PEP_ID=MMETSP0205-20121125/5388_1 /ASSEMBLY_ACC=CAM_ASM_000278 /TAXON_ID=36767 /ORGANISM="Euplotes focardii, Strain TN1" /LENGTH=129 /DNA_ID=CAMNT_0053070109 /DNA_START=87 /DNA_END=476 /DNA_ORIENTATION=+